MHGDVDSLAGWALGVELLEPLDLKLRAELGCEPEQLQPAQQSLAALEAMLARIQDAAPPPPEDKGPLGFLNR